jgi:hypothetical protein
MAAWQRPEARHGKRLAQLFARLGEKPVRSLPSACQGWAETVAAYRFLDNPTIALQAILAGPNQATLARSQPQAVVWRVQETALRNSGTTQPKAGLGTVQVKQRAEYRRPPTVALTPERVH